MPRFTRPLIAGVAAMALVAGASPAWADDAAPGTHPAVDPAGTGLPAELTLPVAR